MSIQAKVNEHASIQQELKQLRTRSAMLRKRSKLLEDEIEEYLEEKDQPGLKYKGTAITRETQVKRKIKKKSDKMASEISVLEKHGIYSPERVLKEIDDARRYSPTEVRKLKFKTIKEKY